MSPELLTWGVPITLVVACIGFGIGILQLGQPSFDEFWIARGCFIAASLIAVGRITLWAFSTQRHIGLRIVIGVAVWGLFAVFAIEAVRYVNRREVRWLAQKQPPKTDPPPLIKKPHTEPTAKPQPNLVDRGVRYFHAHQELQTGMLFEGPQTYRYGFDPDWDVIAIEICNEFRVDPKVSFADNLTAELYYTLPEYPRPFKLNRGAWLSRGNRIGLGVNDSACLIIVTGKRQLPHQARIFIEEYGEPRAGIDLERITGTLEADCDYPVEIRLISELKGKHYATFNYFLAIMKEGRQG